MSCSNSIVRAYLNQDPDKWFQYDSPARMHAVSSRLTQWPLERLPPSIHRVLTSLFLRSVHAAQNQLLHSMAMLVCEGVGSTSEQASRNLIIDSHLPAACHLLSRTTPFVLVPAFMT